MIKLGVLTIITLVENDPIWLLLLLIDARKEPTTLEFLLRNIYWCITRDRLSALEFQYKKLTFYLSFEGTDLRRFFASSENVHGPGYSESTPVAGIQIRDS